MTHLSSLLHILDLFKKNPDMAAVLEESKTMMKQTINEEILALSGRIFFGLIVASIAITSLVIVGQQVNQMILLEDSGPYLSMGLFGFAAVLSIVGLFYIFKLKTKSIKKIESSKTAIDFSRAFSTFMEGLNAGMETAKSSRVHLSKAPTKPVEDHSLQASSSV